MTNEPDNNAPLMLTLIALAILFIMLIVATVVLAEKTDDIRRLEAQVTLYENKAAALDAELKIFRSAIEPQEITVDGGIRLHCIAEPKAH